MSRHQGWPFICIYVIYFKEVRKNNKIIFRIVEKVRYQANSFLPNTYYVYLIFAHYLCAARKKNSIIYKDVKNVCVRNSLCGFFFSFLSFIRFCFVSLHMTNAEYKRKSYPNKNLNFAESLFSNIEMRYVIMTIQIHIFCRNSIFIWLTAFNCKHTKYIYEKK